MPHLRSLSLAIALLITATAAKAQLAVYKLTFDTAGETINYRAYEGGYYVAPIEGGTGSLILTRTTGGVKNYFTYENFGELFVAVKGTNRKAVISATAANTVSTTTFFAIGSADDRKKIESRSAELSVYVAKVLHGYAVSADSERDLPYSSSSPTDIGVAGASLMTCTLDEGMTDQANRESRTLTTEIDSVLTFLESKGYIDGKPTAAGGGGGGGTAAP